MNTISLIRKLTEDDAKDFAEVLSWLNPIPMEADALLGKLNEAADRLKHMEGRQGSIEKDIVFAREQLAIVARLKGAISRELNK